MTAATIIPFNSFDLNDHLSENPDVELSARGHEKDWAVLLDMNEAGQITGTYKNLHKIVEKDSYFDQFELNGFTQEIMVNRSEEYMDIHLIKAVKHVLEEYGIKSLSDGQLNSAIKNRAYDHAYNPVIDYLEVQKWDGKDRVGGWLVNYLGVEDTPYTRQIGAMFLVSAVARAYKPGCKVDTVLILQGDQGQGKSTALRTLVPEPSLFWDPDTDFKNKDFLALMQKAWIIEFAELVSLSKKEMKEVKGFFSAQEDKFRQPYDRIGQVYKRHCVFSGTTNEADFLRDETGDRRFLPVTVGQIDISQLESDRNQLWAEAVKLYREGFNFWTLPAGHAEEVQKRYVLDEWEPRIIHHAHVLLHTKAGYATVADIALNAFGIELNKLDFPTSGRIRKCLTHAGFKSVRREHGSVRAWVLEKHPTGCETAEKEAKNLPGEG
ncbi:MAG: virulence-associated E family protein [Leptospirales bacterium]